MYLDRVDCTSNERISLPPMTFVDIGLWVARAHVSGLEIALQMLGNATRPYGNLQSLAELSLPRLRELQSASNSYLKTFVGIGTLYEGDWEISALRFLAPPGSRGHGRDFEVMLKVRGDDYGEWSVKFRLHESPSKRLSPFAFGREDK